MDWLPELTPWLVITLVLSIGIFVQSAAGFAAGLLSIPSLLYLGHSIPEASTALLVATIPQNIFGVYSLRRSIDARRLLLPGGARLAFFPLGILVLIFIEQTFPIIRIRQFVGGVVLTVTLMTIFCRPAPRERLAAFWAWLAFPLSGFLQGLVGMGGPPMVFWVSAHNWSSKQIRGFLFSMYLISLGPAIVMLFLFFGQRVVEPAIAALLSIPILLIATWVGLKFGDWLGRERLRRITLALLLAMGVIGLASPWLQRG
jgi:hypothetical protein